MVPPIPINKLDGSAQIVGLIFESGVVQTTPNNPVASPLGVCNGSKKQSILGLILITNYRAGVGSASE